MSPQVQSHIISLYVHVIFLAYTWRSISYSLVGSVKLLFPHIFSLALWLACHNCQRERIRDEVADVQENSTSEKRVNNMLGKGLMMAVASPER